MKTHTHTLCSHPSFLAKAELRICLHCQLSWCLLIVTLLSLSFSLPLFLLPLSTSLHPLSFSLFFFAAGHGGTDPEHWTDAISVAHRAPSSSQLRHAPGESTVRVYECVCMRRSFLVSVYMYMFATWLHPHCHSYYSSRGQSRLTFTAHAATVFHARMPTALMSTSSSWVMCTMLTPCVTMLIYSQETAMLRYSCAAGKS